MFVCIFFHLLSNFLFVLILLISKIIIFLISVIKNAVGFSWVKMSLVGFCKNIRISLTTEDSFYLLNQRLAGK